MLFLDSWARKSENPPAESLREDLTNTRVVFLDPNDKRHGPQLDTWDALCINRKVDDCPVPRLTDEKVAPLWQEYLTRHLEIDSSLWSLRQFIKGLLGDS